MPLQSAHVFASHIGHTGKTTLCFQLSCCYAKAHPDISVLVMDLAEEGDLSKRLLGGVDSYNEKSAELTGLRGSVFKLLGDAKTKESRLTNWLWASTIDVTKYAIPCSEHNPNIPKNLFLVSSGAWPQDDREPPFKPEKRKALCKMILDSMETSEQTWKLFCDTDGDRRPSPFTMLGYGLCSQAIVPMHLNKGDLDRTETMLGVLAELRAHGEISTQVLLVVWNMVKSLKEEPCRHGENEIPFTPSKVSLDILDACNKRLVRSMRDPALGNLFLRGGSEVSDAEFLTTSTCVVRQLADNVQKPAEELGMPFVEMAAQLAASGKKQMKFQSGPEGVEYDTKAEQIQNVEHAINVLVGKFESMALASG